MSKKAFTVVELVVVAGIIVLVFSAALLLRGSAASADKDLSGLEEYYNLQSRLEGSLKQDLRCASQISKIEDGNYELKCLQFDDKSDVTSIKSVFYKIVGKERLKVERIIDGKTTRTYDFTSLARGRKLKFEIKNFD